MHRDTALPTAPASLPGRAHWGARLFAIAVTLAVVVGFGGCMPPTSMLPEDISRPADSEFGPGPRSSSSGRYEARLELAGALSVGPMHGMTLHVGRTDSAALENVAITVGGGMPEHGHGLPTNPRATRQSDGSFRVDGVRFNMGGWWVLAFAIDGPQGRDTVSFNFDL